MYKVFVNDSPIIFTQNNNISTNLEKVNFESARVIDLIDDLFQSKIDGICLLCNDLEGCFEEFKSYFKIQKAAGGKVENFNKEILFIYRLNKWDLPKGKLEKGETNEECALREVEEECGVSNLKIEKGLETTYHIFRHKGETIFKITYWYLMNTNYSGALTPQIEEGIMDVVFKNNADTLDALENTYENVKLLF